MMSTMTPSTTKRLLHELHLYHERRQRHQPTTTTTTTTATSEERNEDEDEDNKEEEEEEETEIIHHLQPIDESQLNHWTAVISGPKHSAYEGGSWRLNIFVPDTYPLVPPRVTFLTGICHPNIDFKTGEICLDLLKEAWTPLYRLSQTVGAIRQLLVHPQPDHPLNLDVSTLMRLGDDVGAQSLIRFYTLSSISSTPPI